MARPFRVEFPGACCHVINRGNFRFPVFGEVRDRELVLEKLVELGERLGSITVSGLGSAYRKMARRLRESVELRERVGLIEAVIADAKSKSEDCPCAPQKGHTRRR